MGKHSATTTFDQRNENISLQQRDQIVCHTSNTIEVWTSEPFRLVGSQVIPIDKLGRSPRLGWIVKHSGSMLVLNLLAQKMLGLVFTFSWADRCALDG